MRALSASSTYLIVLFFLAAVVAGMLGTGCASMGMPTGGPRDSLPPVLISVTPADSTLQFTGKKITFVFNEYIQLDNVFQQLLVSPTPKIAPDVRSHLRTMTVNIKDTLEPNTTYVFDFGNAVKDINEQNPLRGFTYLFTTGDVLDSLELTGKVVLAESGKTDSTLQVVLHTSFEDSAVRKTPRYRAKLDGQGNFRFRYLPADTFALYAVKDESGPGVYLSKDQLFAFADSAVNTLAPPTNIVLYAYKESDSTPARRGSTLPRPAVGSRPAGPVQDRRLQVNMNLQDGMLDLLSDLEINFPAAPLRYFDSTKVILANEQFIPVTGYRYIRDTGNKKITLDHNWEPNAQYHLLVDKDFAEDTLGRKLLKSDTLSFITRKESEYGFARLRFRNIDLSRNPIIQFVQNDAVMHTHVLKGREFSARLFRPGEYELRIVYDENGNGKWDAGEFYGKRRQPEKVITLTKKYTVRANFDNEVDVDL